MIFVSLLKIRGGTAQERIGKRAEWQYPEGIKLIGEYWLHTNDPRVISIVEADNVAPIMSMTADWEDFFEITIVPAITGEEGLNLAKQMMQE